MADFNISSQNKTNKQEVCPPPGYLYSAPPYSLYPPFYFGAPLQQFSRDEVRENPRYSRGGFTFGDIPRNSRGGFGDTPRNSRGGFGDIPRNSRGGFGDTPRNSRGGFGDNPRNSRGGFTFGDTPRSSNPQPSNHLPYSWVLPDDPPMSQSSNTGNFPTNPTSNQKPCLGCDKLMTGGYLCCTRACNDKHMQRLEKTVETMRDENKNLQDIIKQSNLANYHLHETIAKMHNFNRVCKNKREDESVTDEETINNEENINDEEKAKRPKIETKSN